MSFVVLDSLSSPFTASQSVSQEWTLTDFVGEDTGVLLRRLIWQLQVTDVLRFKLLTVLVELANNAIDHGLLGLDSAIKEEHDGFERFYELRESRMVSVTGYLALRIDVRVIDANSSLVEVVAQLIHSGQGFDYAKFLDAEHDDMDKPSGRGIDIAKQLADDIVFSFGGRRVAAHFVGS